MIANIHLEAQTVWHQFDKLMGDGSYKSAYALAEKEWKKASSSTDRLAAAYHMTLAAAPYQEDVRDSAEARYRGLLPRLDTLEKALCHAFLGEYDSALAYAEVLQKTPVEHIAMYCNGDKTAGVTPTAFDVVCLRAQDNGNYSPEQRVDLQRRLTELHKSDNDDVALWHELRLLDLLENVPNHPVEDATVLALIDRFRPSAPPRLSLLYARMAQRCLAREDYLGAIAWCDTALRVDDQSEGGIQCHNIKRDILLPRIEITSKGLTFAPDCPSLQQVRYRNVEKLWFRVIPYIDDFHYGDKTRRRLQAAKPLMQWEQALVSNNAHRFEQSLFTIPPLASGKYLLLASPHEDFKAEGFVACELNVTDMYLIQNGSEGILIDRKTGHPIVGQQLRLERIRYQEPVAIVDSATTDKDGRYRFSYTDQAWYIHLVAEREGYRLQTSYEPRHAVESSGMTLRCELRTDRPIYRPGDTVQIALLLFYSDGVKAYSETGKRVNIRFFDPNYEEVATDSLTTDDYGMAHTSVIIPQDRLAGGYTIVVEGDDNQLERHWVRVEEYKQPRFMVTLDAAAGQAPTFGNPCAVSGLAASYSAVPIGGARVQYKVMRRQLGRWWWRWWGVVNETEVLAGETVTAADGSFAVNFVPEPDSNVDLSDKPTFEYEVSVDVTDLNGESHPAHAYVRVGYCKAFLSLEPGSTVQNPKVRYVDINGNPLPGNPEVRIELLRQPERPLLDHPLVTVGVHPIEPSELFEKYYPRLAPDAAYNDPSKWPVIPAQDTKRSGMYRITMIAPDANTVTEYLDYTPDEARKVNSQQLLWTDINKKKAEVGEKVTLRLGSRHKGVDAFYQLRVGSRELDFRRIRLNDELDAITIPVDESMLGGFQVDIMAVMEGIESRYSYQVEVPFSHKRIKMEIATFRDKLLPGQQEEWIVRVSGNDIGVESGVMLTMYDDALNSYGSAQSWDFSPWRINRSAGWNSLNISGGSARWLQGAEYRYYKGNYPVVWSLKEALPYHYRSYGIRMMKTASTRSMEPMADMVEEEAAVNEVFMATDAALPMTTGEMGGVEEAEPQAEPLRANLNSLAFFAPSLRTDTDGKVIYRFIVPDLLTRWNVRGMAVTKDIKIGTLDRTLITQKPLMVQPNMPRFLRQGDNLSLMAKVMLAEPTGAEHDVNVDFLLTDAATGDTLCHHTEHLSVKDAAQVMFPVEVSNNVYVATYKIVARADGMSDGEQGQVPVVTNRQTVTISQALYINGVGEKRYEMSEWLVDNESREPSLLSAEMTSHPFWLAAKVMPYLKDLSNPSTNYLANQLHVNEIGLELSKRIDFERNKEKLQEVGESRLTMNADVKQTLLKATPWVCAAKSEEEQMRAVSRYFDPETLVEELQSLAVQLTERQNPDGGWSWMPDGKSSLWTSQQVLAQLAKSSYMSTRSLQKALDYVDKEQQQYYDIHVKPYLKKGYRWSPTDIDYLYSRSFYGKANTEAYRFYYSNALKNYREYDNLFSQAQLALVFYRHGDTRQALDLLRRIKEKSLESDEMGLYWRDNISGWYWYSRPIETQSLLIHAFAEIMPRDTVTIGQMQQWLLKQKQTTHWGNERATAEAISALMIPDNLNDEQADQSNSLSMNVFGVPITAKSKGMEGYTSQQWSGSELDSVRKSGNAEIVLGKSNRGIAWGAVYYQFTDDIDKIPSTQMGIQLKRTYLIPDRLEVGDRVKVRIDIQCDRAMDYLELVDGRPSCVEPLSTQAGWRWNDGLSYYVTVNNTDTRCYIEHLDKGKYWFEYEVYVTNPGQFLSGPLTMQCMYAPEFHATAPAQKLIVEP